MSPRVSIHIDPQKLRAARHRKALTLRELSIVVGVDHNVIWMYEKGRRFPTLRTIRKLATALDIEPVELLKEENP
jgi:transcriptional regulator with XRE-family HTH domain